LSHSRVRSCSTAFLITSLPFRVFELIHVIQRPASIRGIPTTSLVIHVFQRPRPT
jgi:hypothetical protein